MTIDDPTCYVTETLYDELVALKALTEILEREDPTGAMAATGRDFFLVTNMRRPFDSVEEVPFHAISQGDFFTVRDTDNGIEQGDTIFEAVSDIETFGPLNISVIKVLPVVLRYGEGDDAKFFHLTEMTSDDLSYRLSGAIPTPVVSPT